jgi:hypothetical protein
MSPELLQRTDDDPQPGAVHEADAIQIDGEVQVPLAKRRRVGTSAPCQRTAGLRLWANS